MKIEEGRYYRTRNGSKVGPMIYDPCSDLKEYKWRTEKEHEGRWTDDGLDGDAPVGEQPTDIIAEWTEPQPLKIKAGKFYMTRDGRRVGPMTGNNFKWVDGFGSASDPSWENWGKAREDGGVDIVSEAPEYTSPIRTIQCKEIVPGEYGLITIDDGAVLMGYWCWDEDSVSDLRQAIQTLTEIADALEEGTA